MNTSEMLPIAERFLNAPDNYARIGALLRMVPQDTLSQVGMTRATSSFGAALAVSGVVVVGAAIGAGVALLLAPTAGKDLRERLRAEFDRFMAKPATPEMTPVRVTSNAVASPTQPIDGKADGHRVEHARPRI